jgi:hypothetical protein
MTFSVICTSQVEVLVPPSLEASARIAVAEEGETVSLSCLAKGVPPPTILWTFQVKTFPQQTSGRSRSRPLPNIFWTFPGRDLFPVNLWSFQEKTFSHHPLVIPGRERSLPTILWTFQVKTFSQ